MTQGFSPRAKISFAPELPAGVVALNEPVDMFFQDTQQDIITAMNDSLPEGFTVSRAEFPGDDSPSLGKLCTHAEYFIRCIRSIPAEFFGDSLVQTEYIDGWHRLIISAPAQNPIGGLVKFMVREKIIAGWHEINIVRASIGRLKDGRVTIHE